MKTSQTLAAERLQAFEKLDKAAEQKRRLDRFGFKRAGLSALNGQRQSGFL